MPPIPATQEAESRGSQFEGRMGKNLVKADLKKKKKARRGDTSLIPATEREVAIGRLQW
jgi:hypothetical protein